MGLNLLKNLKNTISKYHIRPSKGLGQNFLIDRRILDKIIRAADIRPSDTVVEIGPGLGVLTKELAKRAKTVIAIEKDAEMCEILKETIKDYKNIEVINKDILKINFQFSISNFQSIFNFQLPKHYKVVANLPYYITSPVIRMFLEIKNPPELMVLMVQKEVGQRICEKPPRMNLLAVSVQFYGKPEIVDYVSKKSFWPKPKIDSAILKISAINQRRKSAFNQRFFRIVKAGFSQPRKQLANNLSKGLALSSSNGLKLNKEQIDFLLLKNKINPSQRAETLSIEGWIKLTRDFKNI